MQEMTPGAALRELQQAQAGLRKARELLKLTKHDPRALTSSFAAGWKSLAQAHRLMASIPSEAADDAVLTKQLSVARYATALLVRLRRLKRHESDDSGLADDEDEESAGADDKD
jgi:hypothetical protein